MKIKALKYKIYFSLLIFFSPCGFAYEFNPFTLSANLGYAHDSLSFDYKDSRFSTDSTICEKINSINTLTFGASSEYYSSKKPYFFAKFLYAYMYSNDAKLNMTIRAQNASESVVQDITNNFTYKLRGHYYDLSGKWGYPFRIGPLFFLPVIGIFYENETLKRKNVEPFIYEQGQIKAFFFPTKLLHLRWLLPLTGIYIILEPWPFTNLRFRAGYDFQFGWFDQSQSYVIQTTVGQTIRNFKKNVKDNSFAFTHLFSLEGSVGLTQNVVLSLLFGYEYWRAEKGHAHVKDQGTENIGNFTNSTQITFNGLHRQIFKGTLQISYGF